MPNANHSQFTLDYRQRYVEAYRQNVEKVHDQMRQGQLDEKITTFCGLHRFKEAEVRQAIASSPIVAAFFAYDPQKQNFYTNTAAKFIQGLPRVFEFQQYARRSAMYVVGGRVFSQKQLRRSRMLERDKAPPVYMVLWGQTVLCSPYASTRFGWPAKHPAPGFKNVY